MIRLGVNIDHVATLRQARRGYEPDPVHAAALALLGGADGITLHLREDRRHIQDRDLFALRQSVPFGLNLELAAADEVVDIACRVKPDQATLVPERREELTTEGGLDVVKHRDAVARAVEKLHAASIEVALFVDPAVDQVHASALLGAVAVELQTASYCEARGRSNVEAQLRLLSEAANVAHAEGLRVHVGHGLNYWNVQAVARLAHVEEMNIGHSIVSRAVLVGLERAVRDMKNAIAEGSVQRG